MDVSSILAIVERYYETSQLFRCKLFSFLGCFHHEIMIYSVSIKGGMDAQR